ncbi:MAG: CoA transferase [Dehalococcoidia bacterium]|nr:CoA transferase [Dehalococcoidia bacterium]
MFEQALSGVKVIDLTHYISGPYCTKMLADYGADVIKVERPGDGDGARKLGPFLKDDPHSERSGFFAYLNTNKRGITLNLQTETGRAILLQLIEDADILVENFSPTVMPGLGLSYDRLKQVNPLLVMVSISNFGQTGPYRDFKASELVLNAMGTEMYSRGISTREPLKLGGNAVQMQAGSVAALATVIGFWALPERDCGDHLDISIFETQISTIDSRGSALLGYQYSGKVATRRAPGASRGYPNAVYMCSDGYVQIGHHSLDFFPRALKMLGNPEELSDPAMGTPAGQMDDDLRGIFDAYFIPWCLERTKQEIFLIGQSVNLPVGPVNTMEDIVTDPHFEAREFFVDVEHSAMGTVRMAGAPFRMEDNPWKLRRPAPLLGQHNGEIFEDLGYSREDLVRLREAGVI